MSVTITAGFTEFTLTPDPATNNVKTANKILRFQTNSYFEGDTSCHLIHCCFGHFVGQRPGVGAETSDTRDIDNVSPRPLEVGEAGLAQLHGGLEVDRHALVNILAADLDEVLPRQIAGVVDEDVKAAHDGDGLADRPLTLGLHAHIALEADDLRGTEQKTLSLDQVQSWEIAGSEGQPLYQQY